MIVRHALISLILLATPGCSMLSVLLADPLENQVSQCLTFGGSPEYTKAGDARTYKCVRG